MIVESDTAQFVVLVIACIFFKFMTTAEKLLRKMLKLVGGQTSDSTMGNVDSTDIKDLAGYLLWKKTMKFYDVPLRPVKWIYGKAKEGGTSFTDRLVKGQYAANRRDALYAQYGKGYLLDENGRPVKISNGVEGKSELDKKIEHILNREYEYEKTQMFERISKSKKLRNGLIKIPTGIVLAAASNKKGIAVIGAIEAVSGLHTVLGLLGKPIKGYKKTDKSREYRTKNKVYNDLRKWAEANVTLQLAENIQKDWLNTKNEVSAKNKLKLATLTQARSVEIRLREKIADCKEGLLKGKEPGATEIEKKLADKYTKELKNNAREAMKTVEKGEIRDKLKGYMQKHHKYTFTMKDFEKIAEDLDVTVYGKEVDEKLQKDEFLENVKATTMAKFVKELTEKTEKEEESSINMEAMDRVEQNLKNKLKKAKGKEKEGIETTLKCLEDKKNELQGEKTQQVYSNASKEMQQTINRNLAEATDDTVIEKQVKRLNRDELVDTIKKAVDMEDSIKRKEVKQEFKPIIEEVQKIRDLDEISRDLMNGKIYKDVGKLVEDIINNTKVTNRPQTEQE